MNNLKVGLLMGVLSVLLVLLGSAVGGSNGAILFFAISMAMNFFSYYFSDKMVIRMTGAQPLEPAEAPRLHAIVRGLSDKAGIPMPRLYVMPASQPNAFATGRNPEHAAVAVTQGLVQMMNEQELTGVLAHEIAHIKNRDILIGTIAASFAGAISMIANVAQWGAIFGGLSGDDDDGGFGVIGLLLMAIVAPIAALIVQMAISRSREYQADSTGAQLAGGSSGLSQALQKLGMASGRIPMDVSPAASHMFIMNPLSGQGFVQLFSTHPPLEERIARLNKMRY